MWLALVSGWLNFFSQQKIWWVNCCSIAKLCMTLCNPVKCSTPGFPTSPSPGACSNSCPLSRWCHPTISSSVAPFSSCLQSFPAPGSFPVSQLFPSGGQNVGASASVFPINTQGWFPLGFKESTANAGDIRDSDTAPDWKDPLEESMTSTSVFLPGGSHGQSSLVGNSSWGF